jgi:hypothetical protein
MTPDSSTIWYTHHNTTWILFLCPNVFSSSFSSKRNYILSFLVVTCQPSTPSVLDLEACWVWKRFLNLQAHKLLYALGDVARAAWSYCDALFLPPTVCMNTYTCSVGLHAILSSQSTQPVSRQAGALCMQASRVCRICGSSAETESFFTATCRWLKQN